jgi:hypothetical protein
MNKRELFGPSPAGGARAGFQYVNEVSGAIEPYRAMPLLAISNAECKWVGDKRPKILGKLLLFELSRPDFVV